MLLPSIVPAGKSSDVTFILHGVDKIYKTKINVTPIRHWNIFLYNYAHVDIGYTHKDVDAPQADTVLMPPYEQVTLRLEY